MTTIANLQFQASASAWAILHFLAQAEPDFAEYQREFRRYDVEFTTGLWNNCRERGFVIEMSAPSFDRSFYVAFFEHRNSDAPTVESWFGPSSNYGPPATVAARGEMIGEQESERVYRERRELHDVNDATQYIYDTLEAAYQRLAAERDARRARIGEDQQSAQDAN